MQVSVRQDDEPHILGLGVFAGLFFADKRIVLLGFRLQDGNGESAPVQQEVIHKAVGGLLEVFPEGVESLFLDFYVCFQGDIGGAGLVVKETPPRPLE
jgi:hypothetical protein